MTKNVLKSQSNERLSELCIACNQGELAGVELSLHQWHRQGDCPSEAYVLLACCLSRRGRYDDAAAILHRAERARPVTDPSLMMVMVCVFTLLDQPQTASKHMRRLHARFGHLPYVSQWLEGINILNASHLPSQSDAIISELVEELLQEPRVLRSLTVAMKIEPNEQHIDVLRQAGSLTLNRVEPSIDLEVEFCQSLAELALLADDQADARRWAHRGLKINPLAAHLAIVLSQVDDHVHIGPSARDVLAKVNEIQPTYPDAHAALIRREFFDGDTQSARMRLSGWLETDPENRTALSLRKEIAA